MKTENFFVNSSSQRQQPLKARAFTSQEEQAQPNNNTNSLFGLTSDNLQQRHNRQFSGYSDKDSVCSGYSGARGKRLKSRNISMKSAKGVSKKSKTMDYTNYAYNEAVGRLKLMLADSYVTPKGSSRSYLRDLKEDSTDNYSDNMSVIERPVFSDISKYLSPSQKTRMSSYRPKKTFTSYSASKENLGLPSSYTAPNDMPRAVPEYLAPQPTVIPTDSVQAPVEIFNFIEKQEDYIEQLEKESKYCRGELSNLLDKVKEVIHENEQLTENARAELANFISNDKLQQLTTTTSGSSDTDDLLRYTSNAGKKSQPTTPTRKKEKSPRYASAPNIVYEARISELEAELMQANIDLKRLRVENDELKRKMAQVDPLALVAVGTVNCDTHRKQIEHLQMEKHAMEETIRHLQKSLDEAKSQQYTNSSKRYINDLVQMERSQAELEVKHLRDELDRQHERVRELQHEMSRRIAEERANAERRYNNQVDQLGGDLSNQWEQVAKLQLEIERLKRYESDLKRDLASRNAQIEELKMELRSNRSTFLADMAQANAEKQSLEQEITALRMQLDRAGRENKTEAARLNAEINSLRQRLDRADADLLHSKREVLRLNDEIANLEKELAYGELKNEIRPTKKDLDQRISEMQSKHAETVNELEDMIQNQKQLMDKLTAECKVLTNKLEDTTMKHKQDKVKLRDTNAQLLERLKQIWSNYKELMIRHDDLRRSLMDETYSKEPAADKAEEHLLDCTFTIEKPLMNTSPPLPMIQSNQQYHRSNYNSNNNDNSTIFTQNQHHTIMSPYLENQLQIWQMLTPQQQLQQLQQRQHMTSSNQMTKATATDGAAAPTATSANLVTTNQATVTTLTMTKISKTVLESAKSSSHSHSPSHCVAQSPTHQPQLQHPQHRQHPQQQQAQQIHQLSQQPCPAQQPRVNTTMTSAKITQPAPSRTSQTWPPTITTPTIAPTRTTNSNNMMQAPTIQAPTSNNMPPAWNNMIPQDNHMGQAERMAMATMARWTTMPAPTSMTQAPHQPQDYLHKHQLQQREQQLHSSKPTLCPSVERHHLQYSQSNQQQQQRSHRHSRHSAHQRQPRQPKLTAAAVQQQHQQLQQLQQQRSEHNRERALLLWGQQLLAEQAAAANPFCHNSLPRQPVRSSCDSTEFSANDNEMIDPFNLEFSISSPSLMRSSSSSNVSDKTCTDFNDIEFESISQMSFSPPLTVIKRYES